jgi:hypothetical protein
MTLSGQATETTWLRGLKRAVLLVRNRRLGMLRSMLQRYPLATVWRRRGGFGVLLGDGNSLRVVYSDGLQVDKLIDLLELSRDLLEVVPESLLNASIPPDGSSWRDTGESD